MRPGDVTMSDVADEALCAFCGGPNLEHCDSGWFACHDCSASICYRRGLVVASEPPEDMDAVSELLHELRSV